MGLSRRVAKAHGVRGSRTAGKREKAAFSLLSAMLILATAAPLIFVMMPATAPPASADPGWVDSDWKYRRPITINNPSSALTDYQVLVTNPVYDETGLVGSWHFNEGSGTTAYDSSGRGNNGTLVNGPTWVDGKFGKALQFDGSDDYVEVQHSDSLNIQGPITLETWVQIKSWAKSGSIVSKGTGGTYVWQIFVDSANKRIAGYFKVDTAWRSCYSGTLSLDTWYHVISSWDGTNSYLYINGVQAGTDTTGSGTLATNTLSLFIGKGGTEPYYHNGTIDEVRIYNRALTAEEIKAHYEAKARLDYGDMRFTDSNGTTSLNYWMESDGKFWVKVPSIPSSGTKTIYAYYGNPAASSASSAANTFIRVIDGAQPVVGSWHFDEGSGTTAYDTSGNANNGTLNNFNWTATSGWVDGKYGKALQFDGENDYVDCGNGSSLDITAAITIEARFKASAMDRWQRIVSKQFETDQTTANSCYQLGVTSSNEFRWSIGGVFDYKLPSPLVSVDTWYHFVGTYDRTYAKMYVDGKEVWSSTSYTAAIRSNATEPVTIGTSKFAGTADYFWRGLIDEVRIYNRALTAEEIKAHYQAKARLDYGDMRFTDSDGTTSLNYWMESDGRFWVKVPSIPGSGTKTIYAYYGNPGATSASSVQGTFLNNQIYEVYWRHPTCQQSDSSHSHYHPGNHAEFDQLVDNIFDGCAYSNQKDGEGYVTKIYDTHGGGSNNNPYGSSHDYVMWYEFIFVPDVTGVWGFATDSDDASDILLKFPNQSREVIVAWYGGHGVANNWNHDSSRLVANKGYWLKYRYTEGWGGYRADGFA